jgi:multicomponent K+:H+ antiporter subunit E
VTRVLPYPLLALSLLAMWLLLTQSFSLGQVVLGAGVALIATQAIAALKPESPAIRTFRPVPRLVAAVLVDVVRSNLAVAKIVLSPRRRDRVAGFVRLPLDMSNPYGLAVLACIITATPGTLWVEFNRNSGQLLVHIVDLIDEDAWIRLIKRRYERPLMEIFA